MVKYKHTKHLIFEERRFKMDKNNGLIWALSLIVISVISLTLSITNLVGAKLPDAVTIVLAIVDIIALPFLVYTSVKKLKK